jgi:mRNA-degrading endonuclease RelE of RelBE toxin-antitoxin system
LLDEFARDPITPRTGFDVRPLKGLPGCTWRLRIGDYRVLYDVDLAARAVRITTIRHRSTAYG